MPIRLTPKDTIGGSFTRRQTLPVVAAPSFWAPSISLLRDIGTVWPSETPFLATNSLVNLLISNNPTMWGGESQFGKDLTAHRLGRLLASGFKIHSERPGGGGSPRGYQQRTFISAWRRMGVLPNKAVNMVEVVNVVTIETQPTEIVQERARELAVAESLDNGKPIKESRDVDPTSPPCRARARWSAPRAPRPTPAAPPIPRASPPRRARTRSCRRAR